MKKQFDTEVGSQKAQQARSYLASEKSPPPAQPSKRRVIVAVIGLAILLLGAGWFYHQSMTDNDEPLMATVVAVTPNYTKVQVPHTDCQQVTTSHKVKNKNRNFFNGLFDSQHHPEYINEKTTKQVCQTVTVESQVLRNYTLNYQVKGFLESMVVASPPPLHAIMPLTQLQHYQMAASAPGAKAVSRK